jgi:hypothetical protein
MPEPLTINQAAARLGISERTLRRRIKAGAVKARKVACEGGGTQLLIEVHSVPAKVTRTPDTVPDNFESENANVPDTRAGQSDSVPDTANGEVLALLKSENAFLRGLVEQRDRDAAELRAALREALKAMPKALPDGAKLEQVGTEKREPIEPSQAASTTNASETAADAKQSPQRGAQAKKLAAWQRVAARILGIR